MTRAEYAAKYGAAPTLPAPGSASAVQQTPSPTPSATPVKMTRAEYAAKYGSTPPVTNQADQTPTDNRDLLQKTGDVVNSIFPGKQVGQAIGTLGGYATEKVKGLFGGQDNGNYYDTSAPNVGQVLGDVAQGALTVAAPEIGNGSSMLGRIGANAALGAAQGGANSIAQGKSASDIGIDTVKGGLLGGGISAGVEGAGALVKNLPVWLTKKALPKLNSSNVDYALENTKLGTIDSNLAKSDQAVKSYGNQIQSVLSHPQYANEVGDGAASLEGVIQAFPHAKLDAEKVAQIASDVVPGSEKLVNKISEGTATLLEKNELRQQLDQATKKVFTDSPQLTFNKQVVHSFANSLRNEVQSVAPETEPIFNEFSKELNLNGALRSVSKKMEKGAAIGLYDVLSAMGGSIAGIPGSLGAVAAEKALRSPGVGLAAAKGANVLKSATPLFTGIANAAKSPAVKLFTNQ